MMFEKNQGLVFALCAASFLFGIAGTPCQAIAQFAGQPTYYQRPDAMLEPEAFLEKAHRSNTRSVMQRYEILLEQNSQHAQPTNHNLPSNSPQGHVRRQIPSRLVPPGYEYSVAPAVAPAPQSKPLAQPEFSLANPANPAPRSNVRPARTSASFDGRTHSIRSPQSTLPPEQNQQRYPQIQQPLHAARIMTRSQGAVGHIPGHDSANHATRAKIISYTQDVPDENNAPRPNPFAEPPGDVMRQDGPVNRPVNQQGNPFADPPADILNNQQIPDPFDEPPADMREGNSGTPAQDPFGGPVDPPQVNPTPPAEPRDTTPQQSDNPLQEVDPFPITPGTLDANRQTQEPRTVDPSDTAPGRTPNAGRDTRRPTQPAPRYRTGPYESFNGYQPKQLLPAPPDRMFPDHAPMIAQPYLPFDPTDDYLSQPSLMTEGFQTAQLYEGINYDQDTRLASYECEACNQAPRLRMPILDGIKNRIARFARIGSYDYQTFDNEQSESNRYNRFANWRTNLAMQSCGGCGSCDQCFAEDRRRIFSAATQIQPADDIVATYSATSCCCEPMFYFSLFGGYAQLETSDPVGSLPGIPLVASQSELNFEDGFGLGVGLGQWQGRNLRTEIEYVYRRNDISSIARFGAPTVGVGFQDVDGAIHAHAGMFNAYWDFNCHYFGFKPYLGGGLGFAFLDYNITDPLTNAAVASQNDENAFAYQLIVGASRQRSANQEWFVEHRYFNADSLDLGYAEFAGESDYTSKNIFFGFRKRF